MTADSTAAVRDEQVEVLFRQARITFVPNLVAVPAIVYLLYAEVPHVDLLAWGAAMYAVTAARALLVWLHGRRPREPRANLRWATALVAANSVSGSGWGAAGFFFVTGSAALSQAFVIVTIAAMTSGAVSSLSALLPAYVAFAVPCVGPLIVRMFLAWGGGSGGDGVAYLMIGILAIVYLGVHVFFARNTERNLVESIRLRFENVALVEQLKREKERAESASLAKTKFLAAASHDLRQPMHALGLFIDALRAEPHTARGRRLSDSVADSHQAATALLDNLLEFSRVESGSLEPVPRVFPVQALLDSLRNDFAVQASAAELELRVRACGAQVRSDPILLARLVGNLVANAIRYTDQGRVLVGCRREAGALRIEVHDTGIGIAPERQAHVFREFYQVDGGARRRGRSVGMGLGLAIVAGLAQALGHAVSLRSQPGRGSAFCVRVPVASPVAAEPSAAEGVAHDLRGRTVLVIDDDPAIVEALAVVLARWGCIAAGAAGAREGIAAFASRGAPDAMVVDAQLDEGASGIAAVAEVRSALGGAIPAIIVTGDTDPARMREAAAIGYPLLHKPLSPMRLRAALFSCLEGRAVAARPADQRAELTR